MKLSKHAEKRVKQRLSGHEEYFAEALEKGLRAADVSGDFKRYLDMLMLKNGRCNVVVYKNFAFLFGRENCLITTFSIPARFHKITKKKMEKKEELENGRQTVLVQSEVR